MISPAAHPRSAVHASRVTARYATAVLIVLLLLATGLRFYRLGAQSFWNDEGNSARLSERSMALIIEGTASDIHPPLYYLILRGWRELLGESEFGLRSFSAFAGVLTAAASVSLAGLFLRPRTQPRTRAPAVLLAGLLAAVNPALVYYSQEARMYALLALLAALATLFLLRWQRTQRPWPWGLAYVLVLAAGLYTHYFFPAIIVVHGGIILMRTLQRQMALVFNPQTVVTAGRWWSMPARWLALVLASLVLYAPWLPVFLRQAGGRTAVRGSFVEFAADSLRWMLLGTTAPPTGHFLVLGAAVLLVVWGGYNAGRSIILPLLGVVLPVILMFAAGTTQPAFFKFMLLAVPFLMVTLAAGFRGSAGKTGSGAAVLLPLLPLLVLLGSVLLSLNNLYFGAAHARADYRGMAARIAAEGHENAGVILDAPNQWEVFTYYHREGAPVYPLPKGQPDPAILEPELAEIAQRHRRLYAIFWGEEQRDPQRVVERWLDANAYKASEEWIGDVRFVVYAVPGETAEGMQTAVDASFGEAIVLEGYTLGASALAAGDILPVTLFWTTGEALATRYKVFLHMVDPAGNVVAQRDSEPGGGLQPTTTWQPGATIVDKHGVLLPQTLPPGNYELLVGLYDAADPEARLPLSGGGRTDNALSLGEITVQAPLSR